MPAAERKVELLTRAGCHLCDDARRLVERVAAEAGVPWRETDVDGDPGLRADYGDLVPVVLVDGKERGYWRIEEARLRRALGLGMSPDPLPAEAGAPCRRSGRRSEALSSSPISGPISGDIGSSSA